MCATIPAHECGSTQRWVWRRWSIGPIEPAPKLVELMNDHDRFVAYSAAGALGYVVGPESPHREKVVPALQKALDDPDPEVGLSAAEALTKIGEGQRAAGSLLARFSGADAHLRDRARRIMSLPGVDSRGLSPGWPPSCDRRTSTGETTRSSLWSGLPRRKWFSLHLPVLPKPAMKR